MCLGSIKEQYDVPSSFITDGWKEFRSEGKDLHFLHEHLNNSTKVPFDVWIEAKEVEIKANCGTKYTTGFHVYSEEPINKSGYTRVNDRLYRIKTGRAGNVSLIEKGIEKERFCIHPCEFMPAQDNMLAQLLLLKSDESKFRMTANRTLLHP